MNEQDKQKLYAWACEYKGESCFLPIDTYCESYYIARGEEAYLKEYSYETLPEVQKELENYWKNEEYMLEIVPVVAMAAIKNKSCKGEQNKKNQIQSNKAQIKPFIYNF